MSSLEPMPASTHVKRFLAVVVAGLLAVAASGCAGSSAPTHSAAAKGFSSKFVYGDLTITPSKSLPKVKESTAKRLIGASSDLVHFEGRRVLNFGSGLVEIRPNVLAAVPAWVGVFAAPHQQGGVSGAMQSGTATTSPCSGKNYIVEIVPKTNTVIGYGVQSGLACTDSAPGVLSELQTISEPWKLLSSAGGIARLSYEAPDCVSSLEPEVQTPASTAIGVVLEVPYSSAKCGSTRHTVTYSGNLASKVGTIKHLSIGEAQCFSTRATTAQPCRFVN